VNVENNENGVVAHFKDGSTASGDALIGADGQNSTVYQRMFGDQKFEYAGYICWRGICARSELITADLIFESSGHGHRFGATNIGGGLVYWYACINLPQETNFAHKTREELVLRFIRFHAPVAALIEGTPEENIICQPCFERSPLKNWSKERVTLLGNAAHPMSPILGQSICEGLEDGITLANCLNAGHDTPTALAHYEMHRAPRSALMQRTSQQASRLGQVEHPLACTLRNLALRYTPRFSVHRHYNQILGLSFNGKASA